MPDAQSHTCYMAQCNDSLQPVSITPAAPLTAAATAASTALTQAVVTTAATANSAFRHGGGGLGLYLGLRLCVAVHLCP
ncbi:TPA: hypothetical protein ACH3X1_004799 [Trebouxia sp. C0004]